MGVNVIFNDINYQILPKQRELFDQYNKIIQWGRRHPTRFAEQFMNIQFTDMQKWLILNSWLPSTVVWCCSRSTGKACELNTKIYSAIRDREVRNGKKLRCPQTIGELQVGDKIYDDKGNLTEVIHLNPIIFDDEYKIYFEDDEVISCNGEHLWKVNDRDYDKRNKNRPEYVIRNTDFIYNNYLRKSKNQNDYRFHVPLNEPIKYPEISFYGTRTIHPYLFGYWLGDGSSNTSIITSSGDDVDEAIKNLSPYVTIIEKEKEKNKNNSYKIKIDMQSQFEEKTNFDKNNLKKKTMVSKLRNLGVLNNKHIPLQYMYAPIEDRLELLRGLMDTDGSIDKKGWCEFTQTNKKLIEQVQQLLTSLGIMSTLCYKEHTGYIKKDGTEADTWRLQFIVPKEIPIFKLKRKFERQREDTPIGTQRKAIVKVEKTGKKVPMRCITVNNKSGLFLCGEKMTVTHNSYMGAILVMLRSLLFPSHKSYIMGPSGGQSQETFTKIEDIAKDNIASAIGISSVFLDECTRMNAKADPFTHSAQGYSVELYNGSEIHSLNSVAKNIVGRRMPF